MKSQSLDNFNKKRQWGTEKSTAPLPILHEVPTANKLTLSRIAIVTTVFFWILYIFSIVIRQLIDGPQNYHFTVEAFSYAFVVTVMTFSSLMYLIARHGALKRFAEHSRVPRAILDDFFAENKPSVTVLIPSYNEEYEVVRKTVISAALQEYPGKSIVLLLDDNPHTKDSESLDRLKKTRGLSQEIGLLFREPRLKFEKAVKTLEKLSKKSVSREDVKNLADNYIWASKWLTKTVEKERMEDHVDSFFAEQVFLGLAKDLFATGEALSMAAKNNSSVDKKRLLEFYRRLTWIFEADIRIFERKEYISLSHEPNKASNLNAYIGLMGGTYEINKTPDGKVLTPSKKGKLVFPDSDFVLTLDADSLLLREYCLRLVYFISQPGNERIAVTQTPYSSFRGAFSRIERLAGATTDVQHILHQGMSAYDATFWVGANALIRKAALNDIEQIRKVNGYEIKSYIKDRTVIEDTESSIDLTEKGWRLVNYPERLSYSATPSDFGSLVVQRRRWANGGLLILPGLTNQIRSRKERNEKISLAETLLRINYMASIAWATFGLIFLLAYPYDGRLLSPLVIMSALPYFLAMASDLKYCGYKYDDVLRIYGFNLIMLPVNLAGVLKSLEQAVTGKKIPFARTPKVKDRTPASLPYVVAPLFIVGFSIFTVWRNVIVANWANAAFAAFNALVASWAIVAYIGLGNVIVDTWRGIVDFLYVEEKRGKIKKENLPEKRLNWQSVLYHGQTN